MTLRHFCSAALRIAMPPGRLEEGILYVSTTGSPLTGSGKSFTPLARTHLANRRVADCCLAVRFALNVPGGCRSLHAVVAFFHTARLTLTPYSKSFFAFGSGKSRTPCARMHSANFTAFSRTVSFLLLPGLAVLPAAPESLAVPDPEGALEPQPAPISATMASAVRDRRLTGASLGRGSGRRTREGSRVRWRPGAARSARARCRRPGTGRIGRRVGRALPRR